MSKQPDPYLDREGAAPEISKLMFPVTKRQLRDWSEPRTILVCGRACARRSAWLAEADRRLAEAEYRGVRVNEAQRQSMANARRAREVAAGQV